MNLGSGGIKASIIIPAFNAETYIGKAIGSILTTSDVALEVLVLDDKSTDTTRDAVADIAKADSRVRLVELAENRGHSFARNMGIKMARGEWIASLDADDWYAPGRLETLISIGEHQVVDIVADNQYWILPNASRPWRSLFPMTGAETRILSLKEYLELDIAGSSISPGYLKPIIRRSFLSRTGIVYDTTFLSGMDFIFLAQCLFEADELTLTDRPYYYYLNRESSVSNMVQLEDLKNRTLANHGLLNLVPPRHGGDIWNLLLRRGHSLEKTIRHKKIMDKAKRWNIPGAAIALAQDPAIIPFSAMSIRWGTEYRLRKLLSRVRRGGNSEPV